MDLDDRLSQTASGTLLIGGAVLALLPLGLLPLVPLAGDLAAGGASLGLVLGTGWAWMRRSVVLALPLVVAPVATRDPLDDLVRVQVWLGRGRPMRSLRLVATVGGSRVEAGAAGPVVGPWTALLALPEGPVDVDVSCESGGRTWTSRARLEVVTGRYAPPVAGSPGGLTWDRSAWGAAAQTNTPESVQTV